MKQVIQTFKTGELTVLDVPTPQVKSGGVIIRTCASLVSAGTERMVVNFAEKNLLQKAQARPDLVRQVIDKARNDGILSTLESVRNRMDQPLPLGYSSAGIVVSVGAKVTGLQPGDRVACAGGGYASHAEAAYVPRNLVVKLPDNVSFESACFATIGAIAMQGIRQGEAVLGHKVAVIGLGLLGQLTVQLLRAAGCQVFGIDLNQQRVALALEMGADRVSANDNAPSAAHAFTSGRGFDVVLITADTSSNEPVQLAGQIARSRATIVAVGAVGMEIPRKVFYDKELSFRLSRSYGPGRYDPEYEEKGHDYPYDYVRWTEQRNIEAFVELLGQNKIGVQKLITHRFPIENAAKAYELITGKTGEPFLGVLLTYPEGPELADTIETAAAVLTKEPGPALERVTLGVLGAGNFANATLLPVIKQTDGVDLIGIASGGGLTARTAADKFGFRYCSTAIDKLFHDPEINTVVILTRHNQHAGQVIAALNAGKHVYVEKPLCLTNEELDEIVATYQATTPTRMLMVGFNRRFAPFIVELKDRLNEIQEPLTLNFRVNAGFIPREHWAQDLSQGGGRLLGEGCHFIDLLIFLAASSPKRILCRALPDGGRYSRDNFVVMLEFENGSLATVTYTAGGDKGFGKERLEVFGGGLAAAMDNYTRLVIRDRGKKVERSSRLRQDKGWRGEWEAIASYLLGRGPEPIALNDIVCSTRATLAAWQSLESNQEIILTGKSAV